jgi:hypothetical protein
VIRKHARHRRQVAAVALDYAKQRDDRSLVGGDAVEVARSGLALLQIPKPAHVVALPLNGEPDFLADARYPFLAFAPSA